MSLVIQPGTVLLLPVLVVEPRDRGNVILETPGPDAVRFRVPLTTLEAHGVIPEVEKPTETVRVQTEPVEIPDAPPRTRGRGRHVEAP